MNHLGRESENVKRFFKDLARLRQIILKGFQRTLTVSLGEPRNDIFKTLAGFPTR